MMISIGASAETISRIEIEKVIPVGIEKAWAAWTDPKQLESWLTSMANVELKIGGLYELFWEPEHPDRNSTMGCKILTIDPGRYLSFQWKGPVPFAAIMNTDPLPTWVEIELTQLTPDRTRMKFAHHGWLGNNEWSRAHKWQENAWALAFAELDRYLSNK